ncbi:minichromosome maintenance protein MCM [Candidatus Micrarchaeota archaeon]|nr:minichromosome maintenance protein MCM [Candidatus Micrarchaeota archaeon]
MAEDFVKLFEAFFDAKMRDAVTDTYSQWPKKHSVNVDYGVLDAFDPELCEKLLEKPDVVVDWAETALKHFTQSLFQEERALHVRFFNLPSLFEVPVQALGAEHLDRLVRVEGVVSWVTEIKPLMKVALWQCIHCGHTIKTATDKSAFKKPGLCQCGRRDFELLEKTGESNFINMQRAQVQELVEKLRGNAPTANVELWMEEDLVNIMVPGEKFIMTGVLRLRPVKEGKTKTAVYSKFLDVLHLQRMEREFEAIEISKEEEEQIRKLAKDPGLFEKIVKSVAPSIYGYSELKQAIALQLFGGTPGKVLPDGKRIRNDAHILLIGDPGTAKSSVLGYVSHIAPKSVFVSGESATAVGLTASAERDKEGEGWIIKAGAMVLANGGLAIIDEFDKMGLEDRGSIHQAMEQQKISVAKAGIVTQFQSKTAVLAAANPKFGRFDPNVPPAQQFNISPALLSRFDLIFTIKDVLDETRDRKMADHILLGHKTGLQKEPVTDEAILPAINLDLLRKYIAFARRTVHPVLTEEASEKIKEFYVELRRMGEKDKTFAITARQIEGVIRLAEASAKLRLSDRVELQDAERSIALVNFVLNDVFVDKTTGRIDSDIISIGQPKSRVDRMRTILNVIRSLEKQFDLVAVDDVVKEAVAYGLDDVYVRQLIDELKRQGDLYEPKVGHIKLSRKDL